MQAALAQSDFPLLVRLCEKTLRKHRQDLMAQRLLGFALNKCRRTDDAFKAFEQGAALFPDDAELLINYANVLIEHARNGQALPLLEKVCALRPNRAISWIKLAECCYLMTLHEKGFAAALRAAELANTASDQVSALMQKSIHRRELGQVKEAIADSQAAITLNPADPGNHTNRLLFMLADPDVSVEQVATAAREYAAVFEPPLKSQWPSFTEHRGDPWRRLKIGFLSPDFRVHSVMYFVEGLLAQLDRRQFEVYAYYLYPRDDHVTERVQRHADHFTRLAGLTWDEQTRRIRDDGIDILIDLTGHTGGNALLTLARKAAPVQVSWLGYPATTGLAAVDYKFTDEVTDPPNADSEYTERLYRLPTLFACYRPMSRQPLWRYQPRYLVRPTPALANGFITFGSCNNLGKLTDAVLGLWGRILEAVPKARLLIEGKNLEKPEFADSYRHRCASLGLDPDRLDLVALHTDNQYLTYHRIDIALDPFPLTGGTTSFDVLWMGVPLVSMVGASFKSRMGTGILTYLGRNEWLAEDADQYVRIAQQLASDPQKLNALRLGLRWELEQSALMREDIFTHFFSEGLRTMWLQWLAQAEQPGDVGAQMQAIEQWLTQIPAEWGTPATPGVGLEPGKRVTLPEAHQRMQTLLDKAKAEQPQQQAAHGQIDNKHWAAITNLAETVLSAMPHDAMALACLAEVEQAHGHAEFAVTYLRYATQSLQTRSDEVRASSAPPVPTQETASRGSESLAPGPTPIDLSQPDAALHAGQHAEVETMLVGLPSQDAKDLFSLGNALRERGQLDKAAEYYRQTLTINPTHIGGNVNLGLVLWDQGDFTAATKCLSVAARLIPDGTRVETKLLCKILSIGLETKGSQSPWVAASNYLLKSCTPEKQLEFLSLCRFQRSAPESHKINLFNKLAIPLIQAALGQGNFTHAMKLYNLCLIVVAASPSTQERWAWCLGKMNPLFLEAGETYRKTLPVMAGTDGHKTRPVVAFIVDYSISIGSGLDLLLMILAQFSTASEIQIDPVVYTIVKAPGTLTTKCAEWKIPVVDFDLPKGNRYAKDDLADKLVAIRERSHQDGVSVAAYSSTYEGMVCLASSIGLAPLQVYLTMGFHSIDAPRIDAYFAFISLLKGEKSIGGRPWRTLPVPFPNPFPTDDSPDGRSQIAEIEAIRSKWHKDYSTILGTLARTEKLDEDFIDAIATILRNNPGAVFLWFGKEPGPIARWAEARGVAERCVFAGWVNTRTYSRVLDIHLDCFGLPTGLTMMESFSAGTAYVLRRGVESENIGITSILSSISDGTSDTSATAEAASLFMDAETGVNLMMLAENTNQYIDFATRLIQSVEFRGKVGEAAKHFMDQYFHNSIHMGKVLGEHIAEIVATKNSADRSKNVG